MDKDYLPCRQHCPARVRVVGRTWAGLSDRDRGWTRALIPARVEHTFGRPIVAIAGGTHLANATAQHLQHVAEALVDRESVQRVYLNHCSGQVAYVSLLLRLGPHIIHPCPAGTELNLEGYL